jgi:3-hydroxybutyryl-CoA dehydrogenase
LLAERTPKRHAPVSRGAAQNMAAALADAGMVFEGVPEVVDLKREVLAAAQMRRA